MKSQACDLLMTHLCASGLETHDSSNGNFGHHALRLPQLSSCSQEVPGRLLAPWVMHPHQKSAYVLHNQKRLVSSGQGRWTYNKTGTRSVPPKGATIYKGQLKQQSPYDDTCQSNNQRRHPQCALACMPKCQKQRGSMVGQTCGWSPASAQKMNMISMNNRSLIDNKTASANVNKLVLSGYLSYICWE